ncbi:MAG: MFS transporter [Pseudomonadota bacterium]
MADTERKNASASASASANESSPSGRRRYLRWLVFITISLVCFGQYFVYDSVTPLATRIKEELGMSGAQYGLLSSYYSIPNVFLAMVLFAGILVDKLGLKLSGLVYALLCLVGALLTAVGASSSLPAILGGGYGWLATAFAPDYSPELKIMLLGRAIYGVGAEAVLIVNNKVLARWFRGKELAFAFGLNLTIMRLGTFAALNIQAPIAESLGIQGALWFAVVVMLLGLVSFFVYLAAERVAPRPAVAPSAAAGVAGEGSSPAEKFQLRDIFRFEPRFWYTTGICFAFYSAVFPFLWYAPDILVQRFGVSAVIAGTYSSALILGTMIFTPIFGHVVDRYGKRASLMAWGSLSIIPCFIVMALTHFIPIVPIFLIGVALSLVPAALWSSVPLIVAEERLGTAFGVIGYLQNVGLMLFPWIAGKLADASTTEALAPQREISSLCRQLGEQAIALCERIARLLGERLSVIEYRNALLMFSALGVLGFFFALLLERADKHSKTSL